ncbi:MAG TPA: hypothetical protein VJT82_00510 [Pyrinomonadaceae bacterium]|nr:hypothetical protein [Pyrinomonadaceae bacterium]
MNTEERIRATGDEQRRAPRYTERLTFMMLLLPTDAGDADETPRPMTLVGHTRNISTSGLALILPSARFGDRYLTSTQKPFWITLEPPGWKLSMEVTPVRYKTFEREADEVGSGYLLAGGGGNPALESDERDAACLLGVKITKMSDDDRTIYLEYLRRLEQRRDN